MKTTLLTATAITAISLVVGCGSTETSSAPAPATAPSPASSAPFSMLPSSAPAESAPSSATATTAATTPVRPEAATTTSSIPVGGSPSEHYTEGTTPEAPGTACGAATGTRVITIEQGSISCREARLTVEQYLAIPVDSEHGNANVRQFGNGWTCSTPIAGAQARNGWRYSCSNDAREIELHSY